MYVCTKRLARQSMHTQYMYTHTYIMLNIDIDNTLYVHKGQNESHVCT